MAEPRHPSAAYGSRTLKQVTGLIGNLEVFKIGNMKGQWFPSPLSVPGGMLSPGHLNTLRAAGGPDTPIYVVFSYHTPIAWRVASGQAYGWTIPAVKYSVTTSKHQGIARRGAQIWDDKCQMAIAPELIR